MKSKWDFAYIIMCTLFGILLLIGATCAICASAWKHAIIYGLCGMAELLLVISSY